MEVVGQEGDGFVTVDGKRVVAPNDMAYRDIHHAFLWTHGKKRDLGTLPGGKNSYTDCINAKGQVVGYADTKDGYKTPVLWQSGEMWLLPTLNGEGEAHWINSKGDIVGEGPYPCIWHNKKLHSLNSLEGSSGTATCINDIGSVVGQICTPSKVNRAFLYRNGKMNQLDLPLGCTESYAHGINNKGDIVGEAVEWKAEPRYHTTYTIFLDWSYSRIFHAILWHNEICIDLNMFVPAGSSIRLDKTFGINAAGDIFCEGWNNQGRFEYILKRLPDEYKSRIPLHARSPANYPTIAARH